MEVQVLGRLLAEDDGVSFVPSAAMPRQALALLVFNAGRLVTDASLVAELWDNRPPKSASTTLQTYILHLRKLLAGALRLTAREVAREVLVTRSRSYELSDRLYPGDLTGFEKLSAAGRRALAAGDSASAAPLLTRALDLWRGEPLADVRLGRLLERQVRRLEECRLMTMEQRFDAELRLGHHQEILADLSVLTMQHPMHENLHAQLMIGLHRSGRRSQAVIAYHRLRRALVDELGIEPSPQLRQLYKALLVSDRRLDAPWATGDLLVEHVG